MRQFVALLVLCSLVVANAEGRNRMACEKADSDLCVFKHVSTHQYLRADVACSDNPFYRDFDYLYYDINLNIQWPEIIAGKQPIDLQTRICINAFNDTTTDIAKAVDRCIAKVANEDDDLKYLPCESIPKSGGYSTRSSLTANVFPTYMGSRIYTFKVSSTSYSIGAAHGMYFNSYICYDTKQGKVLTLDDLFTDKDKLLELIKKCLSVDSMAPLYGQELPEMLKRIYVSDNFKIEESKISFVYNPYEIACFATGIVEVPIYFFEFTDDLNILTPEGKSILTVSNPL